MFNRSETTYGNSQHSTQPGDDRYADIYHNYPVRRRKSCNSPKDKFRFIIEQNNDSDKALKKEAEEKSTKNCNYAFHGCAAIDRVVIMSSKITRFGMNCVR